MTKVRTFNELAKLSNIIAKTIAQIKNDINKGEPKTVDEVELIYWRRLSELQEETEDVIRASLREEAADGILPPKNGGSSQTGGEHGAGWIKAMNFRTVDEVEREAEEILNGLKCVYILN